MKKEIKEPMQVVEKGYIGVHGVAYGYKPIAKFYSWDRAVEYLEFCQKNETDEKVVYSVETRW